MLSERCSCLFKRSKVFNFVNCCFESANGITSPKVMKVGKVRIFLFNMEEYLSFNVGESTSKSKNELILMESPKELISEESKISKSIEDCSLSE